MGGEEGGYRPSHTLQRYTPTIGLSKALAMHQNCMRCIFQHVGNFAREIRISQLYIIRFSNGFQHNDQVSMVFHMTCGLKFSV